MAVIDGCPCYQCTRRESTCHASCPEYKAWSDANTRARNERNAKKATETRLWEQQRDVYEKTRRKNHDRKKV